MNLNDKEFDNLTGKLESYASQLSALQTRVELQGVQNEMLREIHGLKLENMSLHTQLDDRQRRLDEAQGRLERTLSEMAVLREECDRHRQEAELLRRMMDAKLVENAFLRNCIMLSLSSIKEFMQMVKRFDLKALFYTFLSKTLSEEMGERGLQAINEAVELTDTTGLEKLADNFFLDNHGTVNNKED